MSAITLPITFRAFGNTQVKTPLVPLDRTVSALQADELLVKVAFASVNPMDGKLQEDNIFNLPAPYVLGFDFSGTVVAVGERGDAQAVDPAITIGSEVFGISFTGQCYSEYVVAKRALVASRKDGLPAAEASTFGVAYTSAWEPLEGVGRVSQRAGQWIYIAGAAGGVGHFATQIAKAAGLKVIGSASKPASLELLRKLGVDHVIDYSKQDVIKEVLAVTGGKGADVVYDSTYKAESMAQSAACVASGGMWLRLGRPDEMSVEACKVAEERGATATYGDMGRYMYVPEYIVQLGVVRQALEDVVGLYLAGKIKPHISAVIPFEVEALQHALTDNLNGKLNVGKAIVKVAA
jgi:NADPH2:quinone reductase